MEYDYLTKAYESVVRNCEIAGADLSHREYIDEKGKIRATVIVCLGPEAEDLLKVVLAWASTKGLNEH